MPLRSRKQVLSALLIGLGSGACATDPGSLAPSLDGGGGRRPDATDSKCDPHEAGGFAFQKIATWRDDAKAAYSMIHDDMCGVGLRGIDLHAVPALEEYGLVAGLGPIVEECEKANLWHVVKDAEARGNEIISHSYTHPQISVDNADKEISAAKAAFDKHTSHPITFYIFPYDYFTAETVAAVGQSGHLGARAGNRDDNDGFDNPPINSSAPTNDLTVEFDVWPRSYSKYALFKEADLLSIHVWNAIDRGGWAVREFHSVIPDGASPEGQGFGPISLSAYKQHLDFLVKAWTANLVWTSTPSTVLRYRHARSACLAMVSGDKIVYDTSHADCTRFATPISVVVRTGNDVPKIAAWQDAVAVPTRKLSAHTFSVTADPTRGDVTLSGCTNQGSTVDHGVTLPAKPSPAKSVCDLETVVGKGSPGRMDDLERSAEEFQVLPNPAQGDGRTGTWSWYPQNVTVLPVKDGANTVLRYSGKSLMAWTGVTLAFLGGNGAGSCYDARKYQGVRFKMKGAVSTTDELNGKIILSLVTAETQTRTYGGDLDGEGGHFHKLLSLSPTWQTVSLTWKDFSPPTWGTTTTLTQLATGKFQAMDWGVSDKATSFEVFLDDVELF